MRAAARRPGVVRVALLLVTLATPALAACTSRTPTSSPVSTAVKTIIATRTPTSSLGPTAPVSTGPTKVATASDCPLLARQSAADRVGMRLGRITVLTSGGKTVGCRLYAVQGTPFNQSERLPGPNQPAVEVITARYASPGAAHNAFVIAARRGTNPQQDTIAPGNVGVCYQIEFYTKDNGRDWACGFSVGKFAVAVKTVVVSPALTVVFVAREIATHL